MAEIEMMEMIGEDVDLRRGSGKRSEDVVS
jgi:hypothetical protein